jgi:hypothetical protein
MKFRCSADVWGKFLEFQRRIITEKPTVDIDSGLWMDGHPLVGHYDHVIAACTGNERDGMCLQASGWGDWEVDEPSSPPPAVNVGASWFADDAEWTNAVARDGVRIPAHDDYYLSTHWELTKDARISGRCAMCEERSVTTLHHRTYARVGRERADDLTEVCWRCHARHHARKAA